MISIVVAKGNKNEIGKNNKLLWNLPEDMKHFKELTTGKTVIMGRKTYESIGRLLPNRLNVVVSSTMEDPNIKNLVIFRSLEDVYFHYQRYAGEIFVIGGSSIYEYFKDKCDKLYITDVDDTYEGADSFFPEIDMSNYNVESSVDYDGFKITEYKKIDKEKEEVKNLKDEVNHTRISFPLNVYLYEDSGFVAFYVDGTKVDLFNETNDLNRDILNGLKIHSDRFHDVVASLEFGYRLNNDTLCDIIVNFISGTDEITKVSVTNFIVLMLLEMYPHQLDEQDNIESLL